MAKSKASTLYKPIGKFLFLLLLPFERWFGSKTQRVYVIIESRGKFLLVRNVLSRQKWQLPGGGVKTSETFEEAAVREVHEELGIHINAKALDMVLNGIWQSDGLGYEYFVFKTKFIVQHARLKPNYELIDAAWISHDELDWQDISLETAAALIKVLAGAK